MRIHMSACVVILCFLCPLLCAQGRSFSSPVVCDLGTLAPGQKIVKFIDVHNQLPQPFLVSGVYSTCGCTVVKLMHSVILPHGHCLLRLDITARIWPGSEAVEVTVAGKVGHSMEALRYYIKYDVENLISFPGMSYYVNLGSVDESALPRWITLLIRRGANPTPWDQLRCTVLGRSIKAHLGQPHGGAYLLRLHLARTTSLGIRSCKLHFTFFDHGKGLKYHVDRPMVFRIVGPVDLSPDSIFFGSADTGKVLDQQIVLWVGAPKTEQTFRINSAKVGDTAHLKTQISRNGQAVLFSLHTAGLAGRVAGHIIIIVSGVGKIYRFREDYLAYIIVKHEAK